MLLTRPTHLHIFTTISRVRSPCLRTLDSTHEQSTSTSVITFSARKSIDFIDIPSNRQAADGLIKLLFGVSLMIRSAYALFLLKKTVQYFVFILRYSNIRNRLRPKKP